MQCENNYEDIAHSLQDGQSQYNSIPFKVEVIYQALRMRKSLVSTDRGLFTTLAEGVNEVLEWIEDPEGTHKKTFFDMSVKTYEEWIKKHKSKGGGSKLKRRASSHTSSSDSSSSSDEERKSKKKGKERKKARVVDKESSKKKKRTSSDHLDSDH